MKLHVRLPKGDKRKELESFCDKILLLSQYHDLHASDFASCLISLLMGIFHEFGFSKSEALRLLAEAIKLYYHEHEQSKEHYEN